MFGRFWNAGIAPVQGAQKLLQGDWRGGLGDMAFGPDAYYGKHWKKQTGLRTPQYGMEAEMPMLGGYVGDGGQEGEFSLGASSQQNPWSARRGRGGY